MTGELREAHLHELREEKEDDDQSNLFDFSENDKHSAATLAVISDPSDTGITQVCDEFVPELGMPRRVLNDFRRLRAQLNEHGQVEEHNKAYEMCDLDEEYIKYINSHSEAEEAIEGIVQRLEDGEDITLVCFEKEPKKCHRHVLKEHIEAARVGDRYTTKS